MRIGIKSGCWTLIHSGHVWCIQECAKQCDYLIVLTNTDEYIQRKKGNVPIPLRDRLYILKHIQGVDEVSYFQQDTENDWIKDLYWRRVMHKKEFGDDVEIVVFHSDELRGQDNLPGQSFAEEIIFVDKVGRSESVSNIYQEIQGEGE